MASKTPVGFIGLGNMGSPMAKNLLKNGYPVIATDVFPESCKELQDAGAQVTSRYYILAMFALNHIVHPFQFILWNIYTHRLLSTVCPIEPTHVVQIR